MVSTPLVDLLALKLDHNAALHSYRLFVFNDTMQLGLWVRRFLLEHLIGERNLSRQTQLSYRDTLRLLLPFVAEQCHQSFDQLTVEQISAAHVLGFLRHVEEVHHCTTTTRNQRLAAIRALAGFVAAYSPEHIA